MDLATALKKFDKSLQRARRRSQFEPLADYLEEIVKSGPKFKVTKLLREIKERFPEITVEDSALRNFLRPIKEKYPRMDLATPKKNYIKRQKCGPRRSQFEPLADYLEEIVKTSPRFNTNKLLREIKQRNPEITAGDNALRAYLRPIKKKYRNVATAETNDKNHPRCSSYRSQFEPLADYLEEIVKTTPKFNNNKLLREIKERHPEITVGNNALRSYLRPLKEKYKNSLSDD